LCGGGDALFVVNQHKAHLGVLFLVFCRKFYFQHVNCG
jgi:hypothetical protein